MTKREAIVNLICVVLLVVGAVVLAVFAVQGEPERPREEIESALYEANYAFIRIRDYSYETPNIDVMLETAWQSGKKTASILAMRSRSTVENPEDAIEHDLKYLLSLAPVGLRDAVIDSYIWGLTKGAGDGHTAFVPLYVDWPEGELGELTDGITSVPERHDFKRIVALEADSPASHAGLKINDLIRHVTPPQGGYFWNTEADVVFEILRGEEHARLKQRLRIKVRSAFAEPQFVSVTEVSDGSKLIRVHSFRGGFLEFDQQLTASPLTGINSRVIVDLRGNPGGSVTNAGNLLMELGFEGLLLTDESPTEHPRTYVVEWPEYFTRRDQPPRPNRLVVLVNEDTTSAAEIAAWALQNLMDAIVVGTATRGTLNGSEFFPLRHGYLFVATWGTLLGPERTYIEGIGITPDIIVEQDNAGLAAGRDNVLERAIQLLSAP